MNLGDAFNPVSIKVQGPFQMGTVYDIAWCIMFLLFIEIQLDGLYYAYVSLFTIMFRRMHSFLIIHFRSNHFLGMYHMWTGPQA